MRARDGCTPVECLDLLVALLRENDNCENSLSDDYYVAQVWCLVQQWVGDEFGFALGLNNHRIMTVVSVISVVVASF